MRRQGNQKQAEIPDRVYNALNEYRHPLLSGRAHLVLKESGLVAPGASRDECEAMLEQLVIGGLLRRSVIGMDPCAPVGYALATRRPGRVQRAQTAFTREMHYNAAAGLLLEALADRQPRTSWQIARELRAYGSPLSEADLCEFVESHLGDGLLREGTTFQTVAGGCVRTFALLPHDEL